MTSIATHRIFFVAQVVDCILQQTQQIICSLKQAKFFSTWKISWSTKYISTHGYQNLTSIKSKQNTCWQQEVEDATYSLAEGDVNNTWGCLALGMLLVLLSSVADAYPACCQHTRDLSQHDTCWGFFLGFGFGGGLKIVLHFLLTLTVFFHRDQKNQHQQ